MGLREKVALAMLVSVSTQIVCNHCMPRGHSNFAKSPEIYRNDRASRANKMLTKEALGARGNLTSINDSEVFRFPDVEYPTDSQAGEYYRFLNEYPVQYQSKITNNSSPPKQNFQREAKCKRKCDVAIKIRAKPEFVTTSTECDRLPHPYCFRESSFFPEVEYPLSARDTWMPKYWSRLQDARRNNNVEKDIPSQNSTTTEFSDFDSNYENSPLSTLIKTLNTKKERTSNTFIDHPKTIIPNKNTFGDIVTYNEISDPKSYIPEDRDGILNNIDSTTTSGTNSNIPLDSNKDPLQHIVTTTTNPKNSDLIPEVFTLKEEKGSLVNIVPTTTNSDNKLESYVSKNDPLGDIVTTTTITKYDDVCPKLPTFKEDEVSLENIVSTLTNVTNSDINPESPVSKSDPLGDIVTTTTNTKNSEVIPESPILKEDKALIDTIVSTITNAKNTDIKPESSISKNDSLGDVETTSKKNGDVIREFSSFKEDKVSFDNIVSTTSAAKPDNKPELPVSQNYALGDIVTTITDTDNDNVSLQLPILNEVLFENIVSTATSATNSNTKPGLSISNNAPLGEFVTATTNTKRGDVYELLIPKEDNGSNDTIVSTTGGTNNDFMSKLSNFMHDPVGDIVTATTITRSADIPEFAIVNEEDKDSVDNIISITRVGNSNIKPETSISNQDLLDNIVTVTNTKTSDANPKPLVFKKDKAPLDSIASNTISTTSSDIKPGSFIFKNDPLGEIITTDTNTKNSGVIPELPILKEYKGPIDNIVPTTTGENNNVIKSESTTSKNDTLGDILTTTTNTKNSDKISELPILEEDIDSLDNIISTMTKTINTGIEPELYISGKDLLGDIVTGKTTTTPVNYMTSKMSKLGTLTDDIPLQQSENIISSQFASPFTNSLQTTTLPPNNYNSANDQSLLDIVLANLTNDWISPNDSYVTWQSVPEYFDDRIIYIDNKNALSTQGHFYDDPFNENEVGKCESSASSSLNMDSDQLSENFDVGCIILPTVTEYVDDSWLPLYDNGNITQGLAANEYEPVYFIVESNINEEPISEGNYAEDIIEDPNSTLQYEYVDDASASFTEMPYDLVAYPEFVNDTWSGFVNDSYVLYQPICDYSDDACLLFVGVNANYTRPSGDII